MGYQIACIYTSNNSCANVDSFILFDVFMSRSEDSEDDDDDVVYQPRISNQNRRLVIQDAVEDCFDEARECKAWAKGGECEANPSYMLQDCRKSCHVCKT